METGGKTDNTIGDPRCGAGGCSRDAGGLGSLCGAPLLTSEQHSFCLKRQQPSRMLHLTMGCYHAPRAAASTCQ